MPERTLLVDLDGTLVDSAQDLAHSLNHTLESMGMPHRSHQEIRSFIGQGATTLLIKALATEDPTRVEEARQRFFTHYDSHCTDHTRLFPGWEEVLESDIPLVVLTNKPEHFARKILDALHIRHHFKLVIGGDTLAVKKPDLGVTRHVAAELGLSPERFIMVGDGEPDGKLATAGGFPFWGARWGYEELAVLGRYEPIWLDHPSDILHHWRQRSVD